jgi:hypothetical protein
MADDKIIRDMVSDVIEMIQHRRKCCPTCLHFADKMEECEIAMKRPPAKVIAYGCEHWSEDIPF